MEPSPTEAAAGPSPAGSVETPPPPRTAGSWSHPVGTCEPKLATVQLATASRRHPSAVSFCDSIRITPLPLPSIELPATTAACPARDGPALGLSKEMTSPGRGATPGVELAILTRSPPYDVE